jgi:hypothetical protein
MRRPRWIAHLAVVTAIGVAGSVAGAAVAAPTVKGDTAAYEEIIAAFRKLYALPGYRMKVALSDGSSYQDEFAPPNSHWTVHTIQGGVLDSYVVGNTSATRMSGPGAPGGGQCRRIPGSRPARFFPDPTEFSGELTVNRRPDTEIEGTAVHDYAYVQVAPRGSRSSGDVYLETQSGLPRRVLITGGGDKTGTLDYYDYGATISITLPC